MLFEQLDERATALEYKARAALETARRTAEPSLPGVYTPPADYDAWRARRHAYYVVLERAERRALEDACGLTGHPRADAVWELAWRYAEQREEGGTEAIIPYYCTLAVLVLPDDEQERGNNAQPI
jgi:hypothetical protein